MESWSKGWANESNHCAIPLLTRIESAMWRYMVDPRVEKKDITKLNCYAIPGGLVMNGVQWLWWSNMYHVTADLLSCPELKSVRERAGRPLKCVHLTRTEGNEDERPETGSCVASVYRPMWHYNPRQGSNDASADRVGQMKNKCKTVNTVSRV